MRPRDRRPATLGELKATRLPRRAASRRSCARTSGARSPRGENPFTGIHGYERTVLPALYNAILSKHDFLLLGLRGQAKTRLLRLLVGLLDAEIPAIAGSDLNEDPFAPITKYGRRMLAEQGDDDARSPGSRARSATARSSRRPT